MIKSILQQAHTKGSWWDFYFPAMIPERYHSSGQGQLGDLRPPWVLRQGNCQAFCSPLWICRLWLHCSQNTPCREPGLLHLPLELSHTLVLPLRTDKFRVSQCFVSVWKASAAGSWNCQTWIRSPAGGWAVSPLTCTIDTCVCIRKTCTELSFLLGNSRWFFALSSQTAQKSWGLAFFRVPDLGSGEKPSACSVDTSKPLKML